MGTRFYGKRRMPQLKTRCAAMVTKKGESHQCLWDGRFFLKATDGRFETFCGLHMRAMNRGGVKLPVWEEL